MSRARSVNLRLVAAQNRELPTDCRTSLAMPTLLRRWSMVRKPRFATLPRPSPAARIRGITWPNALKVSNRLAAALSLQSEYGALRVRALDDPTAAGQFKWFIENLAAKRLHMLRCCIDVGDVEIVKPERGRNHRGLGEHAADRLPPGRE